MSHEKSRHVVWDEDNLTANAEYQRLHPVTMHIDEPKTPYCYVDEEEARKMDEEDAEGNEWDPAYNKYAKEVKEQLDQDRSRGTVAPVSAKGRPMLAPGTASGELEKKRRHDNFKQMRKAVYADEGAKFKALLAQKGEELEDEDDDEDNAEDKKSDEKNDGEDSAEESDFEYSV